MKYIQLELQLDEVNNRISELLQEKNSHWTEIAKLAIIVRKQELFKPKFTSFTAWVKDIAEQCDRQPSLIWRYIKASRYYLQLVATGENEEEENEEEENEEEENEEEDLELDRLDEIKAAPEALERLEKVQRQAPTPVFETLRDKVLSGEATVAECREIEKAYRPTVPQITDANITITSDADADADDDDDDHQQPSKTEEETQSQQQQQLEPKTKTITNRGRPKKGREGSYSHLGKNKQSSIVTGADTEHIIEIETPHQEQQTQTDAQIKPSGVEGITRNQIAPTIVRSLTVNLVDWTKQIASMRYPAKYYQDHTEVRVNFHQRRFRLDFLAVVRWSFKRPKDIFVVEIKSCLQDFESDQKWTNYLNFCHYFCFAIPLSLRVEDTDLLNAVKKISDKDKRIGILGIDFQAKISEYLTYPVTVIKTPQKLKAQANKTNLVYETLYERVIGWKDDD